MKHLGMLAAIAAVLAAGGVQWRFSERFSLYVEPQLGWDFLHGRRKLETFRSEHPLTFSIGAGLRVWL